MARVNFSSDSQTSPLDERSHWWPQALENSPHLLALRERTLAWTGGYSYARLKEAGLTASLQPINRHVILEMIVQHLISIGMYQTADKIVEETGHRFQMTHQPWQKTDLMILVSLGVLPFENQWDVPEERNVQFVTEPLEDDFFSVRYVEDPKNLGRVICDENCECLWEGSLQDRTEFKYLRASSLNWIVLHLVDDSRDMFLSSKEDREAFFLTLDTVTSSMHFFEHLKCLYNMDVGDKQAEEMIKEKIGSIRNRILKLIPQWMEFRGLYIGQRTLRAIQRFCDKIDDDDNVDTDAKRILGLLPKLTYGSYVSEQPVMEEPDIAWMDPDAQMLFRPDWKLFDPRSQVVKPREIARQITLMAQEAFKKVPARELRVALEAKMKAVESHDARLLTREVLREKMLSLETPNLRDFFATQKEVGRLVLETFLSCGDKNDKNDRNDRNTAFRIVVEIAKHLCEIGNYHSLSIILEEFLKRELLQSAMQQMANKKENLLEELKRLGKKTGAEPWEQRTGGRKDKRGYSVPPIFGDYKEEIIKRLEDDKPAIPNIEAHLLYSTVEENDDFVDGLINWEKRRQLAQVLGVFYKSQNRPFPFSPVLQIQKVIKRGPRHTEEELDKMAVKWAEEVSRHS